MLFHKLQFKSKTFHYDLEGDLSNKIKLLSGFTIQMGIKSSGENLTNQAEFGIIQNIGG